MAVSDLVKEIRKKGNFSRLQLAKMLGHKKQAIIWMYEHGQRYPKHTTLLKLLVLAMELGISDKIIDMKVEGEITDH